jgi:tetratricopeptide (TPR) repeat protein
VLIADTKLVLRLYSRPAAAMSDILDRGSLIFTSTAVLAISWMLGHSIRGFSLSFFVPLLVLAGVYVPGILAISGLAGRITGGFGSAFQRDYAPTLTCAAAAWTAANLPLLAVAWFLPRFFVAAGGLAYLYFAVLIFFAVRTVFGTGNGAAIVIVCLSWIPLVAAGAAAYFVWNPIRYLLGWLASPFFLFYVYFFLRGELGNLGAGLRNRQTFRRNLEAAAVNPHDGEAQYQLGLIYQQRRQFTEAVRRFQNAVKIDPSQTDAHFQLGRIAREQGRLKDALTHFQTVVNQDDRHNQSEILRELGALYVSARQFEDARHELAEYVERRPYDPEGLFHYGQALEGLGKTKEAREMYERAAEAANLAPSYLRRSAARWGRLARKQTRRLN